MAIIRLLVSVALFAIAIIVILDNLGVNVTALVAGLGIGGIAIGLAAQGIFSDLFAALSILFDKPFRRGDSIQFDETAGTVERIGLKTTRLRSLTGEQVVMANTKLLEREIHNFAGGAKPPFVAAVRPRLPDRAGRAREGPVARQGRGRIRARAARFVRCAIRRLRRLEHRLRAAVRFPLDRPEQGRGGPDGGRPRLASRLRRARARVRLSDADDLHRRARRQPGHALRTRAQSLMPVASLDDIRARVGEEVGVSRWLTVNQARIDAFADATEDRQFIHIDPAAAAQTPFGGTIAHGFLTLSLLSRMAAEAMLMPAGMRMAVNYGLDRVRFLAPVRAGQQVRGRFTLDSIEEKAPGQLLIRHMVTVDIEDEDKPALTASVADAVYHLRSNECVTP